MEAQRALIFVLLSGHCIYVAPLSFRTTVPTTTDTETTTPVPPTLPTTTATTPQIIYDTYCMLWIPCKNGGTCVDVEGHGYYCTCEYEFTGKDCEVHVTTTVPTTTVPDTTTTTTIPTTTVPDTTTITTPGLPRIPVTTTVNAPLNIPKISEGDTVCFLYAPCKNDGTCVNENNAEGYHCDCPSGFTGKNCEEKEETEGGKDVIISDDKCPRKVVVALQHRPIKYMARLNCADGKIRVISAEYGEGIYWNNGMPQVTKICNNQTKCKVPAKDAIFGDPYKGVYKKLIIVYECLKHLHSYRY